MSGGVPDRADTPAPAMAEGLDRYLDTVRAIQADPEKSLGVARLLSDLEADAFALPPDPRIRACTTFIVQNGQELALRIHHPGRDIVRPALCYFHGGGFVFGSIESFDCIGQALAEQSGAVVVSAQYRRFPENDYRAAQEDCRATLDWIAEHAAALGVDPARLAVGGDSVGALFATSTAMMARDAGGPPLVGQLLLYGAYAMKVPETAASHDPLLTPQRIATFVNAFRHANTPVFRPPPLDTERLEGLPPAVIVGAELDPLLPESREYARRLAAAGVATELMVAPGMIHGFLRAMAMSPAAAREMTAIGARLRALLSVSEDERKQA